MRFTPAFACTLILLACSPSDAGDDEVAGSETTEGEAGGETETTDSTDALETDTSSEGETETSGETETDTGEPEPSRVLFVGNSYTFVNNLPSLFEAMTDAAGQPWIVDSVAVAGATVGYHVANPNTATALAEGWDVVVLQGQSFEPVTDPAYFQQGVLDFAALVDANTPGAALVFYETWAREAGNQDLIDLGLTPETMQQGLTEAYAEAAAATGGTVAPIGQAWTQALAEVPAIGLYASDGSHPSLAGSFLATCVFFGVIAGGEAASSDYVPGSLAPGDADLLEPIADAHTMP
ncbi:DUF4886 domain-containing protein [Nannocystaceae bacterium ST9]